MKRIIYLIIKYIEVEDIIHFLIGAIALFMAIRYTSYIAGIAAFFFIWQLGWGMKVDVMINKIIDDHINEKE